MIFSSIEFLLYFLPIFLLLYALTPASLKNATLLAGSLVFYAQGDMRHLALLAGSAAVNFFLCRFLLREPERGKAQTANRIVLTAAVAGNLAVLVLFKYGWQKAGLPLGISFYTFQILAYWFDVYRGEVKKETSLLRFAVFIMMFPQLISGPILLYGEVREQLRKRRFDLTGLQEGLKVFTMGLASKVLLADRIGLLWQEVQVAGFESISTPLAWMGAVAYSLNIYFDFYGYSLMAIGLGKMLGFTLPENFKEPYMAGSVRHFYRRWHMTLGRFFCRYVYIPLGGSRKGELRTVCSLLAVWTLTALWHGSTANFLIWGLFLFVLIVIERQIQALGISKVFRHGPLRAAPHLYLWTVIPLTWMCFAISDVSQLHLYLGRMFGVTAGVRVNPMDWKRTLETYWYLFALGFAACTQTVRKLFYRWKDRAAGMVFLAALLWLCVWRLQVEGQNPFLYFDF